jgi:hypothetical protein
MMLALDGRAALSRGEALKAIELLSRKHRGVVENFGERSVYAATSAVDFGQALSEGAHYSDARKAFAWAVEGYTAMGVDTKGAPAR